MPEQDLDDPDVDPALQKMRGEAMPERVNRHRLVDPRPAPRNVRTMVDSEAFFPPTSATSAAAGASKPRI